ncbi:hypothetical protein C8R45DRAFT_1174312 [Mycena sanguinolenta]|nr:hypothetical protein C8R45DRAFT_1174312 [Mycena sanguinolenta]
MLKQLDPALPGSIQPQNLNFLVHSRVPKNSAVNPETRLKACGRERCRFEVSHPPRPIFEISSSNRPVTALQLLQASPAGGSCGPTASISASEPDAQCYLSMSSAYASARDAPSTCGVPASVQGYLKNSVSSVSQSMLNNINATNFVPVTGRAALVHEHAISNPLHSVFEDLERFAKPVLVSLAALRGLDMGNNKLSSTDTKPDESWLTRQRQPSKLKIDSIKSGVDIPKTLSKKVLLSKAVHIAFLTTTTMPFEALGEDVLLRILSFCDISTVLAVSTINKPLSRIASSKQLWLSLVLDATFRAALDLPPPDREKLECRSTEELIDVTSFEVTLDDITIVIDRPLPQLLPGARYLLLHTTTQQRLCIYDVWGSRRLWHRPVQDQMWEVDLVPGGAARVFLFQSADPPNKSTVQVEEVVLATGASRELFNFGFAGTVFRIMPSAIVGDFLLCTVLHSYSHFNDPTLVLVNWRAPTFAVVGREGPYVNVSLPAYSYTLLSNSSPGSTHSRVHPIKVSRKRAAAPPPSNRDGGGGIFSSLAAAHRRKSRKPTRWIRAIAHKYDSHDHNAGKTGI